MGSPRLPPELTDRIIDFCHNNKRALSNCALTHSSWLATSRLHLFHTITTTGVHERTDRATKLKSIINTRLHMPPHGPSPILPLIRTVKIESFANPDQAAQLWNATHLADTIYQLGNNERLPAPSVHTTLGQPLSQTSAPSLWSFSVVSDIVTHVKLLNLTFGHPSDVWPFLSSFHRLQYLELECVGFDNPPGPSSSVEGIFNGVPLSTIRITTAFMHDVIDSLTKMAGSLSHLEDFGIAYQDIRQGALPQLADAIERRVKCLRFTADCYPGPGRDNEWRPSAFDKRIPEFVGRFRSFDTLVLDNIRVDYGRFRVSFEWITGVLQQLSSPTHTLVLEMTATERSQLDVIPWASIDRIVHPDNPPFKDLRHIKVLVKRGGPPKGRPPPTGRDAICLEVTLRLPTLNRLGLLQCDTAGW